MLFSEFDEICKNYPAVTRIKTEGLVYCFATLPNFDDIEIGWSIVTVGSVSVKECVREACESVSVCLSECECV